MRTTLLTIRLRMDTPGGVTGAENASGPERVLDLRRDPAGRITLPGTTVAGSLREFCSGHDALAGLFGGEPGGDERVPSTVRVLGTRLRTDAEPSLRNRTAIDRHRGAAGNRELFAVRQLPAGTEFDIYLRWDNPDERLATFVDHLGRWRPILGRGASYGAGQCSVTGIGEASYDLAVPEDLLAWLRLNGPESHPEPQADRVAAAEPAEPAIDVRLRIVDGLHMGSGEQDEEDANVSTVLRSGDGCLVPGSSLKGVLRSRGEYICRVVSAPACDDQSCGSCRPCVLFGYSGREGQAGRARIAVHDAVIAGGRLRTRNHVAIDRFTGGAHPGLLYAEEVVTSGSFRLRIDELSPLDEVDRALLHAVLADLHDGLIGLGARSTAGLGTVRVDTEGWQRPDLRGIATMLSGEVA